ncbi:hypothetical protein CAEBREN_24876 [Caenorhabditis brenneri]|uniref:Uncharacterized protein n=1 Tax=Caenorhabditis brenneri TaxID=135651 RepID=G0N5Y5_CAEBE|nr:hypothetical protein CAEBREN_24876 [Caenorhabditis brenneri]
MCLKEAFFHIINVFGGTISL